MTIQIQKEDLKGAQPIALAAFARMLSWAPAAELVQRRYATWARRDPSVRAVRALGSALALICERVEHEPARQARKAALRRQARLNRHRVRGLNDGLSAPALSDADRRVVEAAEERRAAVAKGERGAGAKRAAAAAEVRAVELRRAADHAARLASLRMAETVDLDAAREGVASAEVVERKRLQKQVRLRTRDGLKLLHERGGLGHGVEGARLLAVGLRYRDLYELAQSSMRSCLEVSDAGPRAGGGLWAQAKAAQRRASLAGQVRKLEAAVAVRAGPEALEALRRIAGEGRTVRSLVEAPKRRARLEAAVRAALLCLTTTAWA